MGGLKLLKLVIMIVQRKRVVSRAPKSQEALNEAIRKTLGEPSTPQVNLNVTCIGLHETVAGPLLVFAHCVQEPARTFMLYDGTFEVDAVFAADGEEEIATLG